MKITIDIGHGKNTYKDTGAKGMRLANGVIVEEWPLNLLIALSLCASLKNAGINAIIINHPTDEDVPLKKRTETINKINPDLHISVHHDYNNNKNVEGTTVYYWHTNKKTKELANNIITNLSKNNFKISSLKTQGSKPNCWNNFHMVRETKCSSILIECGFFSNEKDRIKTTNNLQRAAYIESLTSSICEMYGIKYSKNEESLSDMLNECTYEPEAWLRFIDDIATYYSRNKDLKWLAPAVNLSTLIKKVYFRNKDLK